MAKNSRRPQAAKPSAMRTGSKMMMEMNLRGGDGPHRGKNDYQRRPKHMGRGWE